ncbi:hypothetical protein [Halomonas organivorans]|uniref:Uncharacterized protein n=1 Tax=Halomonas organivorans TaxID=257772 RepID=A0A7W5G6Q0_9GAMM|nr:hypothetical protein [Halomonas organivorans]MBB3142803.1 hypothetical protein [Halomonas organivorans]
MTTSRDIDNRIRLSKWQAKVLTGVVSEHRQTRRGVPIMILQAYCNARATAEQDRVLNALVELRRLELVVVTGEAVWPSPGWMERVHPETATDDAPTNHSAADNLPPVRPKSRDTLRPAVGGAPKPVTRPAQPKGCDACASPPGQHHAPECPAVNAYQAGRIPEAPEVAGDGAGQALPAIEYPASVERIHPEEGVTIPPELFNRCAAMHLTLLEQAREDYAQGNQDAGQELRWLIETGEQLLAAGGGA